MHNNRMQITRKAVRQTQDLRVLKAFSNCLVIPALPFLVSDASSVRCIKIENCQYAYGNITT